MAERYEIEISPQERNLLWAVAEMAFTGDLEALTDISVSDSAPAMEAALEKAEDWIYALNLLGVEPERESGSLMCIPGDQFMRVLDAADEMARNILEDRSPTVIRAVDHGDPKDYLPPAEGDTEGIYLEAAFAIKALRQRAETVQPVPA